VESLRSQLNAAEVETEAAKLEWSEERARYQETHDLLRFQIDQLTLTRGGSGGVAQKDVGDIDDKIDEVIHKYDERKSSRRSNIAGTSREILDKLNQTEVDAESKSKDSSPTTTSSPPGGSIKKTTYPERMKVFFLSSFWWPKLDFLKMGENATNIPLRPPVLLLQIAWWVAELREYVMTNHVNLRLLPHSNQFCNCDDCVQHIASYAINSV